MTRCLPDSYTLLLPSSAHDSDDRPRQRSTTAHDPNDRDDERPFFLLSHKTLGLNAFQPSRTADRSSLPPPLHPRDHARLEEIQLHPRNTR